MDEPPQELPHIATVLNHLRDLQRRDDGEMYSDQEIAQWCSEQCGLSFSRTYVWMLRTGRRDKPTFEHVKALSRFFNVPLEFFGDDEQARKAERELELLLALRNSGAKDIALRGAGLSPGGVQSVLDYLQQVEEAESRDRDQGSEE